MNLFFFPLWSLIMRLACLQCDQFSVPGASGTPFFMTENKPANLVMFTKTLPQIGEMWKDDD